MTEEKKKKDFWCCDVWAVSDDFYSIVDDVGKEKALPGIIRRSEGGPFPPNALNVQCKISFVDEVIAITALIVMLGGPIVWIFGLLGVLIFGSWESRGLALFVSWVLAYHPLPPDEFKMAFISCRITRCLYKYFTYRFVWAGDSRMLIREHKPWIGASPPHGVLPFSSLLSVPGINSFALVDFVGAPASVVMNTPFLRYMTLLPMIPVDRHSLEKATSQGLCVGIVPDGIAGIFCQDPHVEFVALKNRKGLARHALRTGTNVLPAYSFGNTSAFSAWWDRFGILEYVSRKCQASIFLYWGRFGLPIPRRTQVTMVYGDPILVDKVENATDEQISALHEQILTGIRDCFELQKDALGYGDKKLVFV